MEVTKGRRNALRRAYRATRLFLADIRDFCNKHPFSTLHITIEPTHHSTPSQKRQKRRPESLSNARQRVSSSALGTFDGHWTVSRGGLGLSELSFECVHVLSLLELLQRAASLVETPENRSAAMECHSRIWAAFQREALEGLAHSTRLTKSHVGAQRTSDSSVFSWSLAKLVS